MAIRILLSLVVCALLLSLIRRSWRRLIAIVRQPRLLALTALAGILIYLNWQAFTIGTLTDRVIETSLGYFINPIVTVLFGVLVFRERLRPTQWTAIALAGVAVGVIVVGYGSVPWIALTLAASFGSYGLVKKKLGPAVDAVSGLTLETIWLAPVAVAQLVIVGATTGLTFGNSGALHTVLLSAAGVATTVPLLLFAAGTRRSTLTVVGILQFVTPLMQFAVGVWLLGEPMPPERWIGFAVVWLALIVLTVDSVLFARRSRRHPPIGEVA